MNKKMYTEPKMETMVLPKNALMDDIMGGLAGSNTGALVGGQAPIRIAPVLPTDTVPVF